MSSEPLRHLRPEIGLQSLILPLALLLAAAGLAAAQRTEEWRSWNQPVEPFRIVGNVYYVGASDVTSFLITTPEGHVLLDGGFPETAALIRASVEKLGFRLADVKILLNSHGHFDHAGGLADLKAATGARLIASAAEKPLLEHGGRGDFAFGDELAYPAVAVDETVADGGTVSLGGTTLTAHLTPGHTRGCTTWTTTVEEGGRRLRVVFVGSASVLPQYRLAAEPSYPGIADDFARTFRVLAALPADVFLAAHGSFFHLSEKAERLRRGEEGNPFVDPEGYRSWVERGAVRFQQRMERERAATASPQGAPR
jgi:metallo-beta-lactamase class B